MLAELFAVVIVTLAVIGPGTCLLQVAWKRGGSPRKVAIATLVGALVLVAWLISRLDSATTTQERISQFIGAWGILFMVVGIIVICAAALGKFRLRDRPDKEK